MDIVAKCPRVTGRCCNGSVARDALEAADLLSYHELSLWLVGCFYHHRSLVKCRYQRSYDSTERIIENHVLPRWGKKRLDEIKQQDVAPWPADKRAGGLAPASVEKIRTMFSRSFVLAKQWDLYERNPIQDGPRFKLNNARTRYLTAEEAKVLLMACDCSSNKQLKPIVSLLLLTGGT